jgi:hypothetical protein
MLVIAHSNMEKVMIASITMTLLYEHSIKRHHYCICTISTYFLVCGIMNYQPYQTDLIRNTWLIT